MSEIEKISSALRRLELSGNEQTIYLSLLREGQATARVLAARTGITRPSVYDQLKSLQSLDLVVELEINNKAHFAAADLKHLEALLEDRIDRLEQSRDFLATALPSLTESLKTVEPKLRFFSGGDGVKQLLKDLMWHDNATIKILWPHTAMTEVFDDSFLAWFDDRRQKRNLSIHSLWPAGTNEALFMGSNDTKRFIPKKAMPDMAYIIFDTKVAFISSGAEAFGFIVESTEFVALQTMQFDTLWHQAGSKKSS